MTRLGALCAIFLAVAVSHPASANQLDFANELDLVVSGAVREQCAMGQIADVDFGNLERPGIGIETQVPFYCNVPFTMTIDAERGALSHTAMPSGQGPYAGTVQYSLEVDVPVRRPSQDILSQRFASRQLMSGGVISSNGGIATDGMKLSIALASPNGPGSLLAGEYTETITITVAPL